MHRTCESALRLHSYTSGRSAGRAGLVRRVLCAIFGCVFLRTHQQSRTAIHLRLHSPPLPPRPVVVAFAPYARHKCAARPAFCSACCVAVMRVSHAYSLMGHQPEYIATGACDQNVNDVCMKARKHSNGVCRRVCQNTNIIELNYGPATSLALRYRLYIIYNYVIHMYNTYYL
jgi:hypothetical protein